jgi:hypothetical protein
LQDLLDQFARTVAGGGPEIEPQGLAAGVRADPARSQWPAGLLEQRAGARRVVGPDRQIGGAHPIERAHEAVGHRLAAVEQLTGQELAVDGQEERTPDPDVGEDRVVEPQIDVLVDEPGHVDHAEPVAVPLLESEGLIESEAERPFDHVDLTREQIGLECSGVLDRPDRDPLEGRRGAAPERVAGELDPASRAHRDDSIGAHREPGIGRRRVEERPVAVGRGIRLEDGALAMRRQDPEITHRIVVESDPIDVQHETTIVDDLHLPQPPIELGVRDSGARMPTDFQSERHVRARHGNAVTPEEVGSQLEARGHALGTLGRRLADRPAVLEGRELGAEHAHEPP